jgi:hypothetical protein
MIEWIKKFFSTQEVNKEDEIAKSDANAIRSRALEHMLHCVRHGDLVYGMFGGTDLNPHGISTLTVKSNFGNIQVSWYSSVGNRHRCITLDGKSFPYNSGAADQIYRAAIHRSYGLLEEQIAWYDRKLTGEA